MQSQIENIFNLTLFNIPRLTLSHWLLFRLPQGLARSNKIRVPRTSARILYARNVFQLLRLGIGSVVTLRIPTVCNFGIYSTSFLVVYIC